MRFGGPDLENLTCSPAQCTSLGEALSGQQAPPHAAAVTRSAARWPPHAARCPDRTTCLPPWKHHHGGTSLSSSRATTWAGPSSAGCVLLAFMPSNRYAPLRGGAVLSAPPGRDGLHHYISSFPAMGCGAQCCAITSGCPESHFDHCFRGASRGDLLIAGALSAHVLVLQAQSRWRPERSLGRPLLRPSMLLAAAHLLTCPSKSRSR